MKRFRKNLYTIEKIVWVRHQMQYIKDKDGYLFSDMVYPTKIKPEDLPEWYVHGRYCKRWGYLSAKGVADLKYIPNLWVNHFLKDDFLLVSYHEPIREVPDGKWIWEKYNGFDFTISGNEILWFLKAARKYSEIDISEIAGQIQEKADMLPQKHPHEFKDFRFDVQAYLDQS